MPTRGLVLCAVTLASASGCLSASDEARASLARVHANGMELERLVDGLEDRMLGTQARVNLWEEMAERHRGVTAVACGNQGDHYTQMLALLERQNTKSRRLHAHRTRDSALARSTTPPVVEASEPEEPVGGPEADVANETPEPAL